MRPDLSILVCSIHTRHNNFALKIQEQLYGQRAVLPDPSRVEIIVLTDTMSMSIGRKRNLLVEAASGEYVVFVDDDDRVSEDYVETLLAATEADAHVIAFNALVSLGGGPERLCKYRKEFGRDHNTQLEYRRIPNHICAVKRVLAQAVPYKDINMQEDSDYAERLLPMLQSQCVIEKPLYHYDFDPRTSACRR
jgi:glycosyltransferase involved in cell wall biosynthesis